ncbi:Endonuclease/exonuclease/phosphatase_superfamily [Hexamita inflata]|uniref:Endonuclease/exonuclease/phosphatase superfamily n=1 Tax=Hexamita inflata TaxID=28002 RepID=A0AA86P4T6_9EUKA|nr:Endonuclease/exonuclease/phosphatase superfamily [Hexamita inflata]
MAQVFPGQTRVISFNLMGKSKVAETIALITAQQPQLICLQELSEQDFNEIKYGAKYEHSIFDQSLGALSTQPFTSSCTIMLAEHPCLKFTQLYKRSFTFFTFTLRNSADKKSALHQLEQFAFASTPAISVGTTNTELKSDLITTLKLERIAKDGTGYTFNNEEFDYMFTNGENECMTVLRHYADGKKDKDTHRWIVLDAMLK